MASRKRVKKLNGSDAVAWLKAHPKALTRLERVGARLVDPRTKLSFTPRSRFIAERNITPERAAEENRFERTGAKGAGEDLERLLTSYRAAQSLTRKRLMSRAEAVKPGSKFWRALEDLRSTETGAKGKKARALVTLGLRDPESKRRVGESPKAVKVRPETTLTRSQLQRSRRERVTGRR